MRNFLLPLLVFTRKKNQSLKKRFSVETMAAAINHAGKMTTLSDWFIYFLHSTSL